MVPTTAEKAFAVTEAIYELEITLWELFYDEFLTICEKKSEELNRKKKENLIDF